MPPDRRNHLGRAALGAVLAAGLLGVPGAARAQLGLAPTGPAQIVFQHAHDACAEDDIPDTPARAFRDDQGRVHLLAPHFVNRAFVGPDLDHVKRDCRVVFQGDGRDNPALFDDRGWLTAVYTADGRSVYALVHDEFHADLRPGLCPSGRFSDCWYNAVTLAVSSDGGQNFTLPAAHLVAAVPYTYAPRGHRVGYFNPSNIVARSGYFYVVAFVEAVGAQKRGNCLMRTNQLADPSSWRAWDGHDFTVALADPYKITPAQAAQHLCTPLSSTQLPWSITSFALHTPSGRYVAVMQGTLNGKDGFFSSDSADLVNWSPPRAVMPAAQVHGYACKGSLPVAYPSLLDPASQSRSFDTVGSTAYLYFTRFDMAHCKEGLDRDLLRVPVRIQ